MFAEKIKYTEGNLPAWLLFACVLHVFLLLPTSLQIEQQAVRLEVTLVPEVSRVPQADDTVPQADDTAKIDNTKQQAHTIPAVQQAMHLPIEETEKVNTDHPLLSFAERADISTKRDFDADTRAVTQNHASEHNPRFQPDNRRSKVKRLVLNDTNSLADRYYLESWRRKIEATGRLNYPHEAKRLYGDLLLLTTIRHDGTLVGVIVLESSKHQILDDAAVRIVQLAAPFLPFPGALRENADILEIVHNWRFLPSQNH